MISVDISKLNNVTVDEEWNFSDKSEIAMHGIHAYPAKFPAFIASKAFEFARKEGVSVQTVADIFCGCGTVSLEAKLHEKSFWGCDINPVAALIARTKSACYIVKELDTLYGKIKHSFDQESIPSDIYACSNERIIYWFTENSYNDLYRLKNSIINSTAKGKYRDAFFCLFSSILKASSKWLTKSIKPQLDPTKGEISVFSLFTLQYQKFIKSVQQINKFNLCATATKVDNRNFLSIKKLPKVDMIISSPPYVTSYEYADLHQLSIMWLDYAADYRDVRKGTIGSIYNSNDYSVKLTKLNSIGRKIVDDLLDDLGSIAKVRSVARYYLDMQKVIKKCSGMLNDNGLAFFVVGDTEYKGIKIKNSEHLIQCLIDEGFSDIKAAKRRVSRKLLTPYRDDCGRFSSDKTKRTVYHEEYIISGRIFHHGQNSDN